MNENQTQQAEMEDVNHLVQIRKDKLNKLKEEGKNPFNITKFNRTHTSKQIVEHYEELEGKDVTIAGRIMAKRIMGKASFCHIQDSEGKIQSYVSINELGEESYKQFKEDDIGDIIGITGFVFKTKTGEISIHAKEVTLLSKSLRPLPEKFHGLKDTDLRYRQRYLDLIVNPEVKDTFLKRSKILQEVKNKWSDKYASAFKTWESNWDAICPFFQFSDKIRKIMYTTNTIESLNRQFRKYTKTKSVFPTDMSLLKCLYLSTKNISKKWDQAYRNWGPILSELSIMFDNRI